ncbi:MAG: NTP transferase domain-containing protein [Novosphingobium sp.]
MIVIPMAGASRRFSEAGYDRPKYMLDLLGRPLFDWAVASFAASFSAVPFLFIIRPSDGTPEFVAQRVRALGIRRAEVVALDRPTAGQAETVEAGLDRSSQPPDEDLAVFNIDTIRPGLDPSAMSGMSGWLEVFRGDGENWSFIEPDAANPALVARTTEKVRISDLCCSGLYHFARADLFREALACERASPSSHELFVAPMYNHLIARGHRIGWREVPGRDVILSGVPAEYEALLRETPQPLVALAEQLDKA